ncbi:MAG: iron-containing redox enzyme family protein [Pseudorhodobacter sp.]|nr:iron-containing redox enzyme family protein [Pseudorhodobacter sp.]
MRSYQGRFVLLPDDATGSVVAQMQRYYDPDRLHRLDSHRAALEAELISPMADLAQITVKTQTSADYIQAMLTGIQSAPKGDFLRWLDSLSEREHLYRNFLIQSSTDLLAEASASALGVIGEYGPPQSALFRILIDEFGYGVHDKKHSVLYRNTLRGFGLSGQYNGYWQLFDTGAIALHNVIHSLFHSPRNFFRQIGFLLFAETSYQRSTGDHYRYLRKHHPAVDATYFGEHAHIDIHHSDMVVNEVVAPLVARFGEEVGQEIILGAELTRRAFGLADQHLVAVSLAFHDAVQLGKAWYGLAAVNPNARCVTPDTATAAGETLLQVGGIGQITASAFANFPAGSVGREV